MGTLALMYHRFNENKYPSTNIQMNVFEQHIKIIKDNKKIFSIYPGSRLSEINVLIPILFEFIKKMNEKYKDLFFVFHSSTEHVKLIQNLLLKQGFKN